MPNIYALALILAFVAAALGKNDLDTDCGLLGALYPVPGSYDGCSSVQRAREEWLQLLQTALNSSSTPLGPVDAANNSISISVFSTTSGELLGEFHHGPADPRLRSHLTSGTVDGNSLYRIGSLTKLLTVYTALIKIGTAHWLDPVTNFIPELQHSAVTDQVKDIDWSSIALGDLVNHLSGLPRDCKRVLRYGVTRLTRLQTHSPTCPLTLIASRLFSRG